MKFRGLKQKDYLVSTFSIHCPYNQYSARNSGIFGGQAFPSANAAYYYQILLQDLFVFDTFWIVNGGLGGAANVDVGVYNKNFAKIISTGSQAASGNNTVQAFTVARTRLLPDVYYLAIAASSTNYTPMRSAFGGAAAGGIMEGFFTEASAFPLPTNATPVNMNQDQIQYFGMRDSTLFQ